MFCAPSRGLQQAMSERSDKLIFRTVRNWPLGGPADRPRTRTKGQGYVRKVNKVNFGPFGLGLVLWFWAPSRGLQGAESENSENVTCRTVRTWPRPLVMRLFTGPATSQVRKIRKITCRTFRNWPLAGPAQSKPKDKSRSERSEKLTFQTFRT